MSTATAARARGLTKTYGQGDTAVTALDDVSLDLAQASFTAVMGPSGSGKSTLMHCLAGLDQASGGEVWIGDTEIGRLRERELTHLRRDRVGFIFQAFNLLPALTAAANITLALDIAGRRPDPAWLATVIEATGLGDRLDHRPGQLSGGQQQRVAVARALVGRPDIVFADEPTGNLDSRAGAHLLDLLRRCVREFGQTIVMVTHDPVAASYADRAVFLADGHVVATDDDPTPQRVLSHMSRLGD
jgi:putative ABC transport system ATP-binding protein